MGMYRHWISQNCCCGMRIRHLLRCMILFALTRISSVSPPTTQARDKEGKIMSPGVLVDASISRIWNCEDSTARVSCNSLLRCRGINNGIILVGDGWRGSTADCSGHWEKMDGVVGIDRLLMHMLPNYLKQTTDATLLWTPLLTRLLSICIFCLIILLSSVISQSPLQGST